MQDRQQRVEVLGAVARVEPRDAAKQTEVGQEWKRKRDARARRRLIHSPAVRQQQIGHRPRDGPEPEQLREVPADQDSGAGEQERGDDGVEARRAWFGAPHDLVPANRRDHADLDHGQGRDREVIDVQDELDGEGLEVGRSVEPDRQVDVLVGRDKGRRSARQPPRHQQREQQRDHGSEHGHRGRGPARADARQRKQE